MVFRMLGGSHGFLFGAPGVALGELFWCSWGRVGAAASTADPPTTLLTRYDREPTPLQPTSTTYDREHVHLKLFL